MLGSDVDGEALNAARALKRLLQADGLDFHDLASAAEGPQVVYHYQPPQPCPVCATRARTARTRDEVPDGEHVADLKWLLEQEYGFNEKERDFLEHLRDWKGDLTEKQGAWFQRILTKVRAWSELQF